MEVTSSSVASCNLIISTTPKAKLTFLVFSIFWLTLFSTSAAVDQVATELINTEPISTAISWNDETTTTNTAVRANSVASSTVNQVPLYAIDGDTLDHLFAQYISNVLSSKQQQQQLVPPGLVDIRKNHHLQQIVASPAEKAVIMLKGSHSQLVINGNLVQYIYNVDNSKCNLAQHLSSQSANSSGPLVITGSTVQDNSVNTSPATSSTSTSQSTELTKSTTISPSLTQFVTQMSTISTPEASESSSVIATTKRLPTTMPTLVFESSSAGSRSTEPTFSESISVTTKFPTFVNTAKSSDLTSAQSFVSESSNRRQSITTKMRPTISVSTASTAFSHGTRSTRHSLISINSTSTEFSTVTASTAKSAPPPSSSTTTDASITDHLTTITPHTPSSAPFPLTFTPSPSSGQHSSPITKSNTRSTFSSAATTKGMFTTDVVISALPAISSIAVTAASEITTTNRPFSSLKTNITATTTLPNHSLLPIVESIKVIETKLTTKRSTESEPNFTTWVPVVTTTNSNEMSTNLKSSSTVSELQPSTALNNDMKLTTNSTVETSQTSVTLTSISSSVNSTNQLTSSPVFENATSTPFSQIATIAATQLPLTTLADTPFESILDNTIEVELNKSTARIWSTAKPKFTQQIEVIQTTNNPTTTEASLSNSNSTFSFESTFNTMSANSSDTTTTTTTIPSLTQNLSNSSTSFQNQTTVPLSTSIQSTTEPTTLTTVQRKVSTTSVPVVKIIKSASSTAKYSSVPKVTRFPSPIVSWHRNQSSTPSTLSIKQTIKQTRVRPKPTTSRFSSTRFLYPQRPTSASIPSSTRTRLPLPSAVEDFYQLKKKFIENKKNFFNRILNIPTALSTTTTRRPVLIPSFAWWIHPSLGKYRLGR